MKITIIEEPAKRELKETPLFLVFVFVAMSFDRSGFEALPGG
jgi:hypothetical protein